MIVKKLYRLTKDQDFKRVIASNQISKNRFFVIYHATNDLGYPRVGVSVSKKHGNAVKRNHIRRQVRAMLQTILTLKESYDILIIVRLDFPIDNYVMANLKLEQIINTFRSNAHE